MERIGSHVKLEKLKAKGFKKMECINSYILFGTDTHNNDFIKAKVDIKTRELWFDMLFEKEVKELLKDL